MLRLKASFSNGNALLSGWSSVNGPPCTNTTENWWPNTTYECNAEGRVVKM
jgi:hypothetical protein